jgi:hypothetical protein
MVKVQPSPSRRLCFKYPQTPPSVGLGTSIYIQYQRLSGRGDANQYGQPTPLLDLRDFQPTGSDVNLPRFGATNSDAPGIRLDVMHAFSYFLGNLTVAPASNLTTA